MGLACVALSISLFHEAYLALALTPTLTLTLTPTLALTLTLTLTLTRRTSRCGGGARMSS